MFPAKFMQGSCWPNQLLFIMGVKITSVTINFYRFATPSNYAKMKGVTKQVVNNWINRGNIEAIYVDGFDLTFVKIPRNEWELRKEWVDRGGL